MLNRAQDCVKRGSTTPGAHGEILIHEFVPQNALEQGQCTLYCTITIDPGGGIPYHPHINDKEYYSMLRGIAVYTEEGVEYTLYPGDTAKCCYGSSHGIENRSNEEIQFVAVMFKK